MTQITPTLYSRKITHEKRSKAKTSDLKPHIFNYFRCNTTSVSTWQMTAKGLKSAYFQRV